MADTKENTKKKKGAEIKFAKLTKKEWEQIRKDPKTIRINDFDPSLSAIC